MEPLRLGLYGGTFSPPHIGHYRAAEAFISQFRLDRLVIMPASIPPHKAVSKYDDPEHRFNMATLAFEPLCQNGRAVVSNIELERPGLSYTADTLRELYKLYGIESSHGIYLLTGTDMFLTLDVWREPEIIFELSHIVYVRRGVDDAEACAAKRALYEKRFGASVDMLMIEPYEISSTELRCAIANGDVPDGTIDSAVMDYIRKAGLYREH